MNALLPAAVVVGYLVGALSPATLAARRGGVDLRGIGSGNPGASNVGRALGRRTGVVVAVLDVLKGVVPSVGFGVVDHRAGLLAAQKHLLSLGITGWQDALVGSGLGFVDAFPVYRSAVESGELRARVTAALWWERSEDASQIDRLVARRPELAARADDIRERLARIQAVDVAAEPLPTLTRRETAVAWQLREGQTMEHVARALQVSPNTLKTQVPSLYAKLGVSNRNDALNALEGAGFFV